jgi:hypothetical protein
MEKLNKIGLLLFLTIFVASCGGASDRAAEISEKLQPGERPENAIVKSVNPSQSSVGWHGTKVSGAHYGTIGLAAGEIYVIDNKLVGGNIIMDMQEIVVLDIQDPNSNARLTGHLKSDDFFSSETHPEAFFEMADIEPIENAGENEPNYTIRGNLTIKDITHGIAFPAFVDINENTLRAMAEFDLDRTLWDVRFRSGRFFENLGDNLIHDQFTISLDVVASQ